MNYDDAKALERDLRYGLYNKFVCIAVEERGTEGNWIVVLWGDYYSPDKPKEYPC